MIFFFRLKPSRRGRASKKWYLTPYIIGYIQFVRCWCTNLAPRQSVGQVFYFCWIQFLLQSRDPLGFAEWPCHVSRYVSYPWSASPPPLSVWAFSVSPTQNFKLNWPCHLSLAGYAWVASSQTATAPRARGRILPRTTSLLHVTTPAVLHATSWIGACAQSLSCPGRATVMSEAEAALEPGLPEKVLYNMLYNMLNRKQIKSSS